MTRRITKYLFFLHLLLPTFVSSQSISSIEINGIKNYSKNTYLSWSKLSAGSKIFDGILDSLNSRVNKALRSEGYYRCTVNSEIVKIDSNFSKIIIDIDEGEPAYIGKIDLIKTTIDSLFINRIFDETTNKVFSQTNINSAVAQILDHFENIVYHFTSVKIESIYFHSDSSSNKQYADLFLLIDAGDKSRIDKIEIEGNTKTKDYVIKRELGISEGALYNQEIINEIPTSLNRIRFFEPAEEPDYFFNSKNEGILKIKVKEKVTNNFDGIFGYVPAINDKEKGYFTGYVNVSLRNILGTGRSAAIRWQQENRYSQELELRYLEPWIFNYPINISGSLFQRKQDSTYVQRSFEGQIQFTFTQDISASLILNSQSTVPTERRNKIFTVYNSNSLSTGIVLTIDTRDDFYAPKKGIVLTNSYKYITKKIDGPKEYLTPFTKTSNNFQRLELDFSYFKELFNNQVAAIGVHARELKGSDVELSDLYLLGGTQSLRGYREKQFQGNRIFWSNLEYRFLLTRRSFAFLFFDTGYYLRNGDKEKNILEISDFKTGYGFGLNIETGIGVLGVSFALAKGDSFRDGKIHFGIINEF